MSQHPLYTIVIPAYNEAKHIGALLRRVDRAFRTVEHEIVVVIDGCVDDTSAVVHTAMRSIPTVRLLESKPRLGKGGAIRRGVLDANGEYICFIDGDNEIDPEYIRNAFYTLEQKKYDVVIGNRYCKQAAYHTTVLRHITSRIYQAMIWMLFGISLGDTQAGLKAFTAAAGRRIFLASNVSGYAFDIDILTHAHAMRYRIAEIPMKQRFKGTSSMTYDRILEMIADTCGTYNRRAHELMQRRINFSPSSLMSAMRPLAFLPCTTALEFVIRRFLFAQNR